MGEKNLFTGELYYSDGKGYLKLGTSGNIVAKATVTTPYSVPSDYEKLVKEHKELQEENRRLQLELMAKKIEIIDMEKEVNLRAAVYGDFCFKTMKLSVDKIIVNGDATVVFWADGGKTVVKKSADDEYDLHHAFCAALAKRVYGHNSTVKKMIARKTKLQKK